MEAKVVSQDSPTLLDRLRAEIRVRHYSLRTEQAYVDWARRFILFHNKRSGNRSEGSSPSTLPNANETGSAANGMTRTMRFLRHRILLAPPARSSIGRVDKAERAHPTDWPMARAGYFCPAWIRSKVFAISSRLMSVTSASAKTSAPASHAASQPSSARAMERAWMSS